MIWTYTNKCKMYNKKKYESFGHKTLKVSGKESKKFKERLKTLNEKHIEWFSQVDLDHEMNGKKK